MASPHLRPTQRPRDSLLIFTRAHDGFDALPQRLQQMAAVETWRNPAADRRAWWHLAAALDAIAPSARRAALTRPAFDDALLGLPRVGDAVADAVRLSDRQGAEWLDELLSALPDDLVHLLRAGLPDLQAAVTYLRSLSIATTGDLALAMRDMATSGDAANVPALERWLAAMRSDRHYRSLAHGFTVQERLQDALALRWADAPRLEPLGSMRRFEPVIADVSFLAEAADPAHTLRRVLSTLGIAESQLVTPTHVLFLDGNRQVSLRTARPEVAAALRVCLTGSARHLEMLDARARDRGLVLRSAGLVHRDTQAPLALTCERDVYRWLEVPFVEPERRHGRPDDFDDDTANDPLIDIADIRGDLHTHTLWSDGRDAIDTVVFAARALKYEYVAITDHSERASAPRTLTRDRIARQADDLERVRQRVPEVEVLHGIEVDIMPDGSLDFSDEILARFDIVLASLHEHHGHSPAQLLARYTSAMRHPLVHVITHPANRVPGFNPGYPLDYDTFFGIAHETGTVIEIDGGPHHLDLDGLLARRAVELGVRLSIDSDCHHAMRLGRQMRLGVGTARRGAIRPRHVVNTLRPEALRAWLAAKRPAYGR